MTSSPASRRLRYAAVLLAVSYGIGAPVVAVLELRSGLFSERFMLPPAVVYLTCIVQVVCAVGVLTRRYARLAAAALTVTTVGAAGAHLRIESPWTALPAVAFTALQVWFGLSIPQTLDASVDRTGS